MVRSHVLTGNSGLWFCVDPKLEYHLCPNEGVPAASAENLCFVVLLLISFIILYVQFSHKFWHYLVNFGSFSKISGKSK